MLIEKAKKIYKKLSKDDESVFFGEDILNNNLFKKLKISKYKKDRICKFE